MGAGHSVLIMGLLEQWDDQSALRLMLLPSLAFMARQQKTPVFINLLQKAGHESLPIHSPACENQVG